MDDAVEGLSGTGISINSSDAILAGNRSCDNGTDLAIFGNADPKIDETNDICVLPERGG